MLHYLPLLLPLHQIVPNSHFPIIPVSFGIFTWQVNWGHQEEWISKSLVFQCSHSLMYSIVLFLEKWQRSRRRHSCEITFWGGKKKVWSLLRVSASTEMTQEVCFHPAEKSVTSLPEWKRQSLAILFYF